VRSARFGVGNVGIAKSRLGAIETSTPAILTPPGLPLWWVYGSVLEKSRHDAFRAAQTNRPNLVMVGAKDGMIHAIRTNPTAMTTAPSGTEAWAFVPAKIASGMLADYTASLGGTTVVTSYPDGSPTLADYRKSDGSFGTMALVGVGQRRPEPGRARRHLDGRCVDRHGVGPGPAVGPRSPAAADAGQGHAKPVVIRTRIAGAERFVVIAASGLAARQPGGAVDQGPDRGRPTTVRPAPLLWRFRTAVRGDQRPGRVRDRRRPRARRAGVRRLHGPGDVRRRLRLRVQGRPGQVDRHGAWNDNTGLGTIEVESPQNGVHQYALFSTELTSGALGHQAARSPAPSARPTTPAVG
jgi:hypothetical protein